MEKATLTEKEFCETVGISRVTAWQLRKAGKLPHVRVRTRVFYMPRHVEQFLAAHERPMSGERERDAA
ncbi:MAG: helix-turn-helix domain-containing protein [Acidobacteria bacterium]|nr:helix-turn-helix domain-containing protein [Acidobacteriota bacterium]